MSAAQETPIVPMPWPELLQKSSVIPKAELKAQLEAIRAAESTPMEIRQQAAYLMGRAQQKEPGPEAQKEALASYDQASRYEPLWERCQWHISECATTLGQEKRVREALNAIKERSVDEVSRAAAEYGLAQSYLRGNEPDRARQGFTEVRQKFGHTQFSLGSAYYMGEMSLSDKGRDEALRFFREYLRGSPDGHFAREIVQQLNSLPDFQPSLKDRELFGQVHYVHGEWQEALNEWSKAKDTQRWLEKAICLSHLNRKAEARQALSTGIAAHPNDRSLPEAAQTLSRMLTRAEAASLWKSIKDSSTLYGDLALWNLALRTSYPQSITYYRQIVSQYPHSDYAAESNWWLVWDQIKQGKLDSALKACEAGLKKYPGSKAAPRFAFWSGKLQEKLKAPSLAKEAYMKTFKLFPSHYYGYRAKSRLAALSGLKDPGWVTAVHRKHPNPGWSWPDLSAALSPEAMSREYGASLATLARLRQWDECLQLLPDNHANPILRSWLFANLQLPLEAINVSSYKLQGHPQAAARWQFAYPLLFAREIAQRASAKTLDPLLIHALVREESRYNQLALSRSNALGLMQLLPGTAYGVAKTQGIHLSGTADVYKPAINLTLGSQYLSYLSGRFKGNLLFAVAGYNGGPNAVKTWSHTLVAPDYDSFVENIPFSETRDYVRKVFGSYWNYEQIYHPRAARGLPIKKTVEPSSSQSTP